MHEKAIEKISGIIRGSLKRCEVSENWPQYDSFTTHVDSLSKEVLKHKSEWLTITDVYSIYYDLVYEAISRNSSDNDPYSGLFEDLISEDEFEDLVKNLAGFYVSIPRDYSIYLPLPNVSENIDSSIKITDSIELITFNSPEEVPGGYHSSTLSDYRQAYWSCRPCARAR